MKIDNDILLRILRDLRDLYPHMLCTSGYKPLLDQFGEDVLDGHLIYLCEKGLIDTQIEYQYEDNLNPVAGTGGWIIRSHYTRINSNGLDLLAEDENHI